MKETNTEEHEESFTTKTTERQQRPSLTLDVEYYQNLLDDEDIPEHQKTELIETYWSIITAVIGLGFGVHPLQQIENEDLKLAQQAIVKLVSSKGGKQCAQNKPTREVTISQKGELSDQFKTK